MALTQSITLTRAPAPAFAEALARTGAALDSLPARQDDLAGIRAAAAGLAAATDVVFLGTGGSSLGGQTLCQLAGHAVAGLGLLRPAPRLHFIDNLDPATYGALLDTLPLATTRF